VDSTDLQRSAIRSRTAEADVKMDHSPDISIVILTKNAGPAFRDILTRIYNQQIQSTFEVVVVDSGSIDGTLEILRDFPVRVFTIPPEEFNFGLTRNYAFSLSRGEYIVTISQDALPYNSQWLRALIQPFLSNPKIVAVQGGEKKPDTPVYYWSRDGHFSFTSEARRWLNTYKIGLTFVNCAIRRSFWESHPIGYTPFGEDKLFERTINDAGGEIVRADSAMCVHGHQYTFRSLVERLYGEGVGYKYAGSEYHLRDCFRDIWEHRWMFPWALGALKKREISAPEEVFFPFLRPICVLWANKRKSRLSAARIRGSERDGRPLPTALSVGEKEGPVDRKLRILFLSQEYPPETGWGGIGSYVASVAPALAARGHEVHVLSCVSGQTSRDYLDQGVHIHRRGLVNSPAFLRLQILFITYSGAFQTWQRFHLGLSNYIECRRLGIGFAVVEYPDWNAEGWLFALRKALPLVVHLHSPLPEINTHNGLPSTADVRWAAFLESLSVHRAHAVTAPSKLLIEFLKKIGWLKRKDVDLIPYALDSHHWHITASVSDTQPIVLFVGRIEPRKAPELLVQALSIIRTKVPEAQAIFIGESSGEREGLPYKDWLLRTCNGAEGLRFVGPVPRCQIRDYLAMSRVMTLPSQYDNYPVAVLEAMAAGRPVVTTTNTGVAELIQRTGSGVVIPSGDGKALAEALLPFLEDSSCAAAVGARARMAAANLHDPEAVARQREAVYMKAVAIHKTGLTVPRSGSSAFSVPQITQGRPHR
jgi:glycogen(starch) synthase